MKKGAIGILFLEERKKVLLVKRADVPVWVLPGGGIEDGEKPENCVEREVFEETGIPVKVSRLIGIYSPINSLTNETYLFECIPLSTIAPAAQSETMEASFFPVHLLPEPFFFLHAEWIEEALLNKSEPIIRPIESITWTRLFLEVLRHPILLFRYLLSRLGLPINSK